MARSDRLFDIIQILRAARRPVRAIDLAQALEVTERTIYRDIAALQGMRVPVAGAAGIGYVMRAGFDLPPLMFDAEEIEAIIVGMALLRRTGDRGLQNAAQKVSGKIAAVLPPDRSAALDVTRLRVSQWGVATAFRVDLGAIRRAIRDERKLRIAYTDERGRSSTRQIRPIAIVYYIEVVVLAAWCEKRRAFRHFRADRVTDCRILKEDFKGAGDSLRAAWSAEHQAP